MLGLAYVVFPFDIIPDVFGPLGIIDDVAVLAFLYTKLRNARPGSARGDQTDSHAGRERGGFATGRFETGGFTAEKPWELLGVPEHASLDEIKAAYRIKLAEYHPDKVNHLGEDLRRLAHEKTLKITEAYNVLEKIRAK